MKYLLKGVLISIFVLLLFPLNHVLAAKKKLKRVQQSEAQATCVYNYTSCRDSCEYYQDNSQIGPCKAKCDRSYGCRPAKIKRPPADKVEVM